MGIRCRNLLPVACRVVLIRSAGYTRSSKLPKSKRPAQLVLSREVLTQQSATPCQRSLLWQASSVSPSWIEKVRTIVGDCQPVSLDGDWPGLTGTGRLCCTSREGERSTMTLEVELIRALAEDLALEILA